MAKTFKVMVGLDLTEMDEILIQKIVALAPIIDISNIYFVHVASDLTLPKEITEAYPDLMAPVDEAIRKDLSSKIAKHDIPTNVSWEVSVKEGNSVDTILRWAKIKDVDFMVVGRKESLEGSGSLSKSLARKAPCSVIFLTEKAPAKAPEKILVPIDFSTYTKLTLEFAQHIANKLNGTVQCIHIYEVPIGYHKTGKSFEEFAKIMKGNAEKEYHRFIQKNKLPEYPCEFLLKENGNVARFILKLAKEHKNDLIIMGSRGRTDSAAVLLGSMAEKLIEINNLTPMVIFKKKGETMGFFEALMKL
ncbi:universal stress protein [Pararhodonellum marinum]|uniref:universal stress protein n=1 Tax=Pararhodonellum marinum TaxID=2755358 RepID=UPI00188E234A|nr:universal stress protein [Pararhodonellum marinum]